MPYLRFTRKCAMIDRSLDHQSAAYAASQRHIIDGIKPMTRPEHGFAKRSRVCIVVHPNRRVRKVTEPVFEIKVRPAFDLMRTSDLSMPPIDRATKPDANSADLAPGAEL